MHAYSFCFIKNNKNIIENLTNLCSFIWVFFKFIICHFFWVGKHWFNFNRRLAICSTVILKINLLKNRYKFHFFNDYFQGKWSWGQISWDRNSTFSWDRNYDHEIEFVFSHEIEIVLKHLSNLIMRSTLWSWDWIRNNDLISWSFLQNVHY